MYKMGLKKRWGKSERVNERGDIERVNEKGRESKSERERDGRLSIVF